MAASHFTLHASHISLLLFSVFCSLPSIYSKSIANPFPVPTVEDCHPVLISMTACAPFVLDIMPSPAEPSNLCCDFLRQLDSQELSCLCIMANDTSLSNKPINQTLASELPILCGIQGGMPTCSGMSAPSPTNSPASELPFGTKDNATVAASPMLALNPGFTITGGSLISEAKANVVNNLLVALLLADIIFVGTTYAYETWSIRFLRF